MNFCSRRRLKSRNVEIIEHINEMKAELELAKQLQLQLLPDAYPEKFGVRFSSLYRPMEELGGDYYDFIRFQEKNMIGFFKRCIRSRTSRRAYYQHA